MSTTITPGVFAVVLISQLGSPQYRERARASHELYQMAPLVVPYLEAARRHEDLEVSQRSTLILATYYESVADRVAESMKPSRWPRLPWIDMLPENHPDRKTVIDYYTQQARNRIGRKGPPNWEDYRLATKLYMRELILERQRPQQVQHLLDRMVECECQWIRTNGKKYTPPLTMPK